MNEILWLVKTNDYTERSIQQVQKYLHGRKDTLPGAALLGATHGGDGKENSIIWEDIM